MADSADDGPTDQPTRMPRPRPVEPDPRRAEPNPPPAAEPASEQTAAPDAVDPAAVDPVAIEPVAASGEPTPAEPPAGSRAEPTTPAAPPTCYRHPGRETHIRCTRCQRSICPDCMISAAVGFQCPNCVREGSKDARVPRTRLGGKVQTNSEIVTRILIAINIGMFLLAHLGGSQLQARLVLIGSGFSAGAGGLVGVANGEWYRLLTATFLHVGLLHLALNMFALWIFGSQLERQLGRARYLTLYLLSGLAGSAVSYAFSQPNQPSLGASGAVFGLVGAALVIGRKLRYDVSVVAAFLVLNLVIGFMVSGIDWRAHLGGLAAGLTLGAAYAYAPPRQRTLVHVASAAGIAVAIVVIVAWRTAALT